MIWILTLILCLVLLLALVLIMYPELFEDTLGRQWRQSVFYKRH